jgi:outer membrane lipoprotein SlyB
MSIDRFLRKQADLSTILPAVMGAPIGGFIGRGIGSRFGSPDLGMLIGGITGGTAGQLMKEKAEEAQTPPPGAPYAMDAASQGIPPWAVKGAQLLRNKMSNAGHSGLKDVVMGDALGPLYPLGQGIKNHDMGGAAKGILGQTAGVVGGGLAGHGAGMLLDKLVGHQVNVPGVNMPLSTLLSGLGATIGGVKGLERARGV